MNCRCILAVAGALWLASITGRAELTWLTDYDTALQQAKSEGKLVLMDFTGSDWCGWCIKLKSEVFDTREFAAFANANLVMLEVDFPRGKAQTEQQRQHNAKLSDKYPVEGYPTIIIASSDGRPLAKAGYMPGGPKAFIGALRKIPGYSWKEGEAVPDAPPPVEKGPAKPEEPLWGGITFPQKRYDELKLTGLSGAASRRLAIINNQTFAVGETARVKLKDGEIKVLCKEIRPKSVVVQVEGAAEPKELFFGGN
jgi:thioredoxin-related protein